MFSILFDRERKPTKCTILKMLKRKKINKVFSKGDNIYFHMVCLVTLSGMFVNGRFMHTKICTYVYICTMFLNPFCSLAYTAEVSFIPALLG